LIFERKRENHSLSPSPAREIALRVQGVSRVYPARGMEAGPVLANDRVSFEVRRGEVLGLLGPNGAGKSTLVMQLIGLLPPSSGQILVEGVDVVREPDRVKRLIGFLPQSGLAMRNLEVERALRYTGCLRGQSEQEARAQAAELLARLELEPYAARFVNRLSGGLMRLANFGMALMGRPKVLVLDEPTNELDPHKRRLVWDVVRTLNREEGVTCVLVTHNLSEAERVLQRVLVMRGGRVIARGTPEELKRLVGNELRVAVDLPEGGQLPEEPLRQLQHLGALEVGEAGQLRLLLARERLEPVMRVLTEQLRAGRIENFSVVPPSLEEVYLGLEAAPPPAEEAEPESAPGPAPKPAREPLRPRAFFSSLRYLWLEQLLELRTTWAWNLVFSLFMPLAMVFGLTRFGSGMGDARSLLYIVSGAAIFAVVTEGVVTMAQRVCGMRQEGMLVYYASLPISRVAFVLALMLARMVITLPGLLTPLVAARVLYGFEVAPNPWIVVLLPLTALCLSSVGMALGSAIENLDLVIVLTNMLVFVLLLATPLFIPPEALPVPLQLFGQLLPPTYAASALRAAIEGRLDVAFHRDVAILVGMTALSLLGLKRWLRWGAA
jgi:ABC-2 type transport system permease protein